MVYASWGVLYLFTSFDVERYLPLLRCVCWVVADLGLGMLTLDLLLDMPLLWTHLIPATMEGKALHNVQNAMFAAGMGYAMGVKLDDIRHGLRTFDTSFFQAPGRMNVYDELGFASPQSLAGQHASVLVYVDDVDAHYRRAREAGATLIGEPADQSYGDRSYRAVDPEGGRWVFATHVRDVAPENML